MSISVFPDVIGQTNWKFRLPVKKTPAFKTLVQTPANNIGETRISLTQYPIWLFEYDLAYMLGSAAPAQIASVYQTIVGFYGQMQGAAQDWLYFDPDDNGSDALQVNGALTPLTTPALQQYALGTGDGTTTTFVITRTIGGMKDLIQNFAHTNYPIVYKNGAVQNPTTYGIDASGNLTFNSPPANATTLAWAGQWNFRCRFMDDQWDGLMSIKQKMWKNSSIKWKSILR